MLVGLISLLVPFLASSFIGAYHSDNSAPPEAVGSDEYSVYSTVIRERIVGEKGKLVLIANETEPELFDSFAAFKPTSEGALTTMSLAERAGLMRQTLLSLSQATVDEYLSKNRSASTLTRLFDLSVAYKLMNRSDAIELYRRQPHSGGISEVVTLSRAGFNDEKDQALIHYTTSGGTDGESFFLLLRKVNGRWSVVGSFNPDMQKVA